MELLRERVRPERDPYFHQMTIRKLSLVVEKYIHYSLGDNGGRWIVRGRELVTGKHIKFEVKEEDLSRKMIFSKGNMERIREGEVYQFMWRIMVMKKRILPSGTERFKRGKKIEVFDGYRKINLSKIHFSLGTSRV